MRNKEVVAVYLYLHTQSAESIGDDAQVFQRHVLDAHTVATHGSHTDERTYLNHVGQEAMLCAVKALYPHDVQQVGTDAADVGTHAVQQVTELLDIRFAGSIVNRRGALSKDCCHDDVGSTRDRGLVKEHVGSLQLSGSYLVDIATLDMTELGTQVLEAQEVGVQSATTYLVASRLGDDRLAHARQQRTDHHDGAA